MATMTIVRMWAAAAWADGTLHPEEAAALRRLIEASDELQREDREQALALLSAPPSVDLDEVRRLDKVSREGVYRAALGIVRLDGRVTPDEEEWIAGLKRRLDLDAATLARIESEHR